jgi:uncharacterized protein YcaQ
VTASTARLSEVLSLPQARGAALLAQGFLDPAPRGRPDARHRRRVLDRIGLIQMDSVNVLARAHYLPMFSRLGPYDPDLLDRAAYRAPRELFEYWGHEASLLPVGLHPALRWRMNRAHEQAWGGVRAIAQEQPDLVRAVRALVEERGPISAGDIEHAHHGERRSSKGAWWDWSHVKRAVEFLFWSGEVTTATRRGFERLYDLPERVLPAEILRAPDLPEAQAHRVLIERAAQSMAVAQAQDLRDYFRLSAQDARPAIASLVEDGVLLPVAVQGWRGPAYLHRDARIPARRRAAGSQALASPFDPLVWNRARTQRLFGMEYRIEIYVPQAERVHGYYVLPFLLGDTLVARVDLKADRAAGVLRVQATHVEPEASPRTPSALADELRSMASWLGLSDVLVVRRGNGARALAAELRT